MLYCRVYSETFSAIKWYLYYPTRRINGVDKWIWRWMWKDKRFVRSIASAFIWNFDYLDRRSRYYIITTRCCIPLSNCRHFWKIAFLPRFIAKSIGASSAVGISRAYLGYIILVSIVYPHTSKFGVTSISFLPHLTEEWRLRAARWKLGDMATRNLCRLEELLKVFGY